MDYRDVKIGGLWDKTSVDQGIGYNSVKRYLVFGTNIRLVDVFAEILLTEPNPPQKDATLLSDVHHKGSERSMRSPEMVARHTGSGCDNFSEMFDDKFKWTCRLTQLVPDFPRPTSVPPKSVLCTKNGLVTFSTAFETSSP
jgi:hypothetical protein